MQVRRVENMAGGEGHVIIRDILSQDRLGEKCRMYAEVTLEPGCSLGVHEHRGECESYYILQGVGEYTDDGEKTPGAGGGCHRYPQRPQPWAGKQRRYRPEIYGADPSGLKSRP